MCRLLQKLLTPQRQQDTIKNYHKHRDVRRARPLFVGDKKNVHFDNVNLHRL